jgi:hypothetical protein
VNELGERQVRDWTRLAREGARDAWREASRAAGLAGFAARALWCALTGRHDWTEWGPSSAPFVPPERRRCRRCGGLEFRGDPPRFRVIVEAGSMYGPSDRQAD